MNNLLTAVVLLLISTALIAQSNTSTVTQTGDDNNTLVNQVDGENNSAVDQIGDLNEAVINQKTTWSSLSNASDVDQYGNENIALVDQWNGGNDATILQDDPSGSNNWARISQAQAGNVAKIWQTGSDNYGLTLTTGGNTTQNVTQIGIDNMGTIKSTGGDNMASILQTGEGNIAGSPFQSAPYGIEQVGTGNIANTEIFDGDFNNTFVDQLGNGNASMINMGKWGKSSLNNIDFDQNGDDNYFGAILNTANNNVVIASQLGNSNWFKLLEIKGDNNNVNMSANGNSNKGQWTVRASWPEFSDYNTLDINQIGNGNATTGIVAGDNNDIDITQTGDGNYVGSNHWDGSGVNIIGNMNDVDIVQFSNGNSSLNTVTGSNNTINVNQN